jgi:probable HAF family extracellular repeat protein
MRYRCLLKWIRAAAVSIGVVAALLVAVSAGSARGPSSTRRASERWLVSELGTLGGSYSRAVAVNDRGQVVGYSGLEGSKAWPPPPQHAFLWQNGRMIDLGTLGGADSSAVAINNRGQVIGYSETRHHAQHAFLWQSGRMIDLGTLGGADSSAVAINNRGQIVGNAYDSNTDSHQAFLWQNGRITGLGTLGVSGSSRADGINDRGEIVGSTYNSGTYHAFLWRRGHTIYLRPSGSSTADAMNNRGEVVGRMRMHYHDVWRGFIWRNGRLTALGATSQDSYGHAFALNGRGQAVGFCVRPSRATSPNAGAARPCLWQDQTVRDLGTLGGSRGRALDINERGQIVGRTTIGPPSRKSNAFIWQNGRMGRLPGLRPHDWSEAAAINEHDQIVGVSLRTSVGPAQAVLWTLARTD